MVALNVKSRSPVASKMVLSAAKVNRYKPWYILGKGAIFM